MGLAFCCVLAAGADQLPALPPGPLLPADLIVTYYGNPLSKNMGILGELAPPAMLDRLAREAALWQKSDPRVKVRPGLELVADVASNHPQEDGRYRQRMPKPVIEKVIGWARFRGWIVVLDVQVGRSTVRQELDWLRPYLEQPDVHLAIDPEFQMTRGLRPGERIGSADAEDVNIAVEELASIVADRSLPPKILIVHRFTDAMLRRYRRVRLDPRVQIVVVMDGYGSPAAKKKIYEREIAREPVQFAGLKLFYKNDKPLLSRQEILRLDPKPCVVIYQ
jgi:hypothetical protein